MKDFESKYLKSQIKNSSEFLLNTNILSPEVRHSSSNSEARLRLNLSIANNITTTFLNLWQNIEKDGKHE